MVKNNQDNANIHMKNVDMHAVNIIEQGEKEYHPKISLFDWSEFLHLSITWFVGAFAIFAVLFALTMVERSNNLIKDVILRLDTLSLMFSLVLSAGLEQVWNNKNHWKYKLTQYGELTLAFIGLVLYTVYSTMYILDPQNPYLQDRFGVHLCYIIISTILVITGFVIRCFPDKEVS